MQKHTLRTLLKKQRESYVRDYADTDFAAQFLKTFLSYTADQRLDLSQCITALYHPFGAEASPLGILDYILEYGHTVALPKMDNNAIIFVHYTKNTELLHNSFGFYEPVSATEVMPDIMILPLLGFDNNGHRLGYGKGHYDKALGRLSVAKPPHLIGLAYPCQVVAELPHEPHDKKLDAVLLPHTYKIFAR